MGPGLSQAPPRSVSAPGGPPLRKTEGALLGSLEQLLRRQPTQLCPLPCLPFESMTEVLSQCLLTDPDPPRDAERCLPGVYSPGP